MLLAELYPDESVGYKIGAATYFTLPGGTSVTVNLDKTEKTPIGIDDGMGGGEFVITTQTYSITVVRPNGTTIKIGYEVRSGGFGKPEGKITSLSVGKNGDTKVMVHYNPDSMKGVKNLAKILVGIATNPTFNFTDWGNIWEP